MNRGEWNETLYARLPDPFTLLGLDKGLARETSLACETRLWARANRIGLVGSVDPVFVWDYAEVDTLIE